jgi:hypothetical protein
MVLSTSFCLSFAFVTLIFTGCGSVSTKGVDADASSTPKDANAETHDETSPSKDSKDGTDVAGGGDDTSADVPGSDVTSADVPGSDVTSADVPAVDRPSEVSGSEVSGEVAAEVPTTECSPAQAPRSCYTGPVGTAGVGLCRAGTQACDATGHWATNCPNQITPQVEACNTMDDDCDGVIDNIPRSVYANDTYTDLNVRSAGCTSGFDPLWLTCNQAIHKFCAAQACRTTGFGFVEVGATEGSVTCLSAEPTREVAAGDLATFGVCPSPGVSTVQASERFACQQAIHGYCKSLGFVSGFGPVGSAAATSWTIVCLRSGHGAAVATSYDALAQQVPGCNGPGVPATAPGACLAAAKRFCQVNNHFSGFGPVENGLGQGTTVVCVDL